MEPYQIIIIVVFAIIALIVLTAIFSHKKDKDGERTKDNSVNIDGEHFNVVRNDKYMFSKELKFYYCLKQILPKGFICFPKVGVDNLVLPVGSRKSYNTILSKYVDFVIFEEIGMKPVLVIDLFDSAYNNESVEEENPNVVKCLQAASIPLLQMLIKKEYDLPKLKKQIEDILFPPKPENETVK